MELSAQGGVTRQRYFDRQLAALMLREDIPIILTENTKDFTEIPGVTPLSPFI